MGLIVVSSERFAEHVTPPGHPESPERAEVMDVVAAEWRARGGEVVAPRSASREQLARVHSPEHLRRMAETIGVAVALDPDTYTSPETYEIALLSAGASVEGVERVMGNPGTRALVLSRPPGHHAERDRAMGFCFFNNVAVAAAHARTLGAERIAIVDFDVHHGNGTQNIFEDDAEVLYLSTHQSPYYPGTGDVKDVGRGAGAGRTVNIPLEVGATDEDYRIVFEQVVGPVMHQFSPDIKNSCVNIGCQQAISYWPRIAFEFGKRQQQHCQIAPVRAGFRCAASLMIRNHFAGDEISRSHHQHVCNALRCRQSCNRT